MKRLRRNRRVLPLHQRFARGYQTGLVVAVIVSAMVWTTTNTGLDDIEAANDEARAMSVVVANMYDAGATLSDISGSPTSLSHRSDLRRIVTDVDAGWAAVMADLDDLPDGFRREVEGSLDERITAWVRSTSDLADDGDQGPDGLEQRHGITANGLVKPTTDLANDMAAIVDVYEAQVDDVVASMRRSSLVSIAFSLAFLLLLVGGLLRPLKRLMQRESDALIAANWAHRAESERQELTSHLADGLEAAETEEETLRVVERAFERLVPDARIELMLADGKSLGEAVVHPDHGSPGCGVDSTVSCPAVRRGRSLTYDDSESINACPHLSGREIGACSATCVPLSFMGESMGVIHTTGPRHQPPEPGLVDVLGLVSSQVAVRIGTLRSFAQVEKQVASDTKTGLPNRRSTEDHLDKLLRGDDTVSVVMADLDRFKRLNDKYGTEAGDRALRMFADAVRDALRSEDWIGRWGGEEFVIVMPGMPAVQAKDALDRVRDRLADTCARAEAPAVTVSMGVVDTGHGHKRDDLIRLADEALLSAKHQGRDRVVVGPVVPTGIAAESEPADASAES